MSRGWNYKSADWYIMCDVCNLKIKASRSKHRWDGFIVCDGCFEQRHSQDFIRVRQDKITVPFQRPRSTDVFVEVCNLATQSAYVGLATADCAKADYTGGYSYSELLNTTYCSYTTKTGIAGIGYAGCMVPMFNADAYL